MISASVTSFLFGAALGMRFKVVAVVPATVILMVLLIGLGMAQHQSIWWIAGSIASAAICLQFGYFAGIVGAHFFAAEPSRELQQPVAGAEAAPRHAIH
jgi:hypothetical protein